jgi:hypothetical protein
MKHRPALQCPFSLGGTTCRMTFDKVATMILIGFGNLLPRSHRRPDFSYKF